MFVPFALPRRLIVSAIVLATAALPSLVAAQTAADHVALGDRDHAAMNAPSALHHYEEAIKLEPNWYDAQRYMEESVAVDPARLVHHLDLARVYAARGDNAKATEQYELVIRGPRTEYNDKHYQAEAEIELRGLR